MHQVITLLLATAGAGLIAGASAHTFLAAAAASAGAAWLAILPRRRVQRLYATLDPSAPDGEILLQAFREALARARSGQRPVLLRIASFMRADRTRFRLDLNRDGDLELNREGHRPATLKQPGAWIPDHPLPLAVPHTRCLTLLFEPSGENRARVSLAGGAAFPRWLWAAAGLAASAACFIDWSGGLAAALGFSFQAYLLEHHPYRPRDDA